MPKKTRTQEHLAADNVDLRARLDEAEETLRAIRNGEVDAIIVSGEGGDQVFTLKAAREFLAEAKQSRDALLSVIEDQKRAEEVMRESEARYRTLIEQAADGIFITDAQGKYLDVNTSACTMLGYTREEILGADYTLILSPDDLAQDPPKLGLLNDGKILLRERLYKRKDGTVFAVEISAKMLSDGRIQSIVRNISERKRAEEEIQKRSNQLEALHQISLDLSAELNLHALLQSIVEKAIPLIQAATCSCYLLREDRQELERIALAGGGRLPTGKLTRKRGEGLIGKVWERNTPIVVDDYSKWESGRSVYPNGPSRAVMGVPIRWGEKFLGVLILTAELPRHFSESDIEILTFFADQAAVAIQNARLFDETQRRADRLSTVNEIAKAVTAQLQLESVLETIYQQVKRILPLDAFYIALYNAAKHVISYPLFYDEGKRYNEMSGPPVESSNLFQSIKTGEPIFVNHSPQELESPTSPDTMLGNRSKPSASLMWVPLKSGTHIIGALSTQSYAVNSYAAEHLTLLSGIANQVAIAIENARLFQDAEQNLQRVQALHQIDRAISSSLDLRVTMNTFLTHATVQLGVDAGDILALDEITHTLQFVAGIGFRTKALQHTQLRLGDGLAGKAALDRKMIVVSDLPGEINGLARSPTIQNEGFVTYYAVPLLSKGRVNGVLEIFHRAPIDGNESWLDFLSTLASQAAIAIDNAALYQNLQQANTDLGIAYDETILGWSNALDLRDHETHGHTERVTEMTLRLAREMGIGSADLVQIRRGGLLHDIGKMGIPDSILLKPGSLTDLEWQVMRQHPDLAYKLLSPIDYLRPALDIPYCHHEKWDGSGYPRGLVGDQIPLTARIFAVVDVWDALSSDRSYRPAWPEAKVREHVQSLSGTHFDPNIVPVFLRLMEKTSSDARK